MGKQGQYQLQGQVFAGIPQAADGVHEHELSYARSFDEGRLPVLICELVR